MDSPGQNILGALAAGVAILIVGLALKLIPNGDLVLPLMASMGASAFLLFVVPHSPMSQPWPLIGGHLIAALAAFALGHGIDFPVAVAAIAIGLSILTMHLLRCLHPPAAATALAIASGELHLADHPWQILIFSVVGAVLLLLLLAWSINHLLGRRYPLRDTHHPHHHAFRKTHAGNPVILEDQDLVRAREQMDGIIDVSNEDLIDIYELAIDHAISRRAGTRDRDESS